MHCFHSYCTIGSGRGATVPGGQLTPTFSGAWSTYGAWPLPNFLSGFPWADLSTLSTTHALVGWCSDAVLQWLESKFCLNPYTWVQWNYGTASQITFAISTCLLDNSAERWKRICFDSLWHLVIFILVRWLNLLTYLLTYLLCKRSKSNNTSFRAKL